MLRDVETTVKLVLALAPGFVALALLELIADLGELNEFRILFYGLALTFVCWVIVLAFLGIGRIFFKRLPVEPSNHPALLVIVFLVAVAIGIGTGMAAERDLFHMVLRSLPGTATHEQAQHQETASFPVVTEHRGAPAGGWRRSPRSKGDRGIRAHLPERRARLRRLA